MVKQTAAQLKREFDTFAANVARLEQLRHELALLPTDGFESDVARIKVRLKDITAIPFIERSLRDLRAKIERHAHASQQKVVGSTIVGSLKRRVADLETLLKQKRVLSKTDASALKELPRLEKQLMQLRSQVQTHLRGKEVKIDSGVGVLVDSTFDEFVSRIKGELSERLREKEGSITAQMQADLNSREELFAQRYQLLVQELERKYRTQLEEAMQTEVKQHLAEEVRKRIAHERTKLVALLLKEQSARLTRERKQLIGKLEETYAQREQALITDHQRVLAREKGTLAQQRARVTERMHRIEQQASLLHKERAGLEQRIAHEKRHLRQEEQRLSTCKKEAERKASLSAKAEIKSAKDRLLEEADALKHTLQLQQAHIATHLATLHAREQTMRQQEEHSKVHLAHERAVLQQSFERLEEQERHLNDKVQQKFIARKVALLASVRTERGTLQSKEKEITQREHHLKESIAKERMKGKQATARLQEELAQVTKQLEEHVASTRATLHEENVRTRQKYARAYRRLAQKAQAEAKHKLHVLRASLGYHQSQLRTALGLVQKREQSLKVRELQVKQSVVREKQALQKRFAALLAHERLVQIQGERALQARIAQQRVQDASEYQKRLVSEKAKMHQELRERVIRMSQQVSTQVAQQVSARESHIRATLERDYKEHMRVALARKQALFDTKKALLEKHVLAQAKRLFK